ncbi:MAG: M56 family metallopeptidase, partial [Bacteroidota bacterium]
LVVCFLPTLQLPSPAPATTGELREGITYVETQLLPTPVAEEAVATTITDTSTPMLTTATPATFSTWQLIYAGGLLLFGLLLLIRGWSIYRLHRRSRAGDFPADFRVLPASAAPGQAFTFGRRIYLSQDVVNDQDLPLILAHERVHARQGHTLDIVLSELFLCVFWFHPVAWWLRAKLRANLEYLVDAKVIRRADKRDYQLALIRQSANAYGLALALPFSEPTLKGRIRRLKRIPRHRAVSLFAGVSLACWIALTSIVAYGSEESTQRLAWPEDEPYHLDIFLNRLPYPDELAELQDYFAPLNKGKIVVTPVCGGPVDKFDLYLGQTSLAKAAIKRAELGVAVTEYADQYLRFEFQHTAALNNSSSSTYREATLPADAPYGDLLVRQNGNWFVLDTSYPRLYTSADLAQPPPNIRLRCLLRELTGNTMFKGGYWSFQHKGTNCGVKRIAELIEEYGLTKCPIAFYHNDQLVDQPTLEAYPVDEHSILQLGAVYEGEGPYTQAVIQLITDWEG